LSGEAHLNPAATIAIYFLGFVKKLNQMAFFSMFLHIIFQFIGAILGQFFLYLIFYFHYQNTSDEIKILETFSTVPSVRNKFVCFLTEFFGTFILLLVFFSLKESNLVINGNISTRILEIFILGMTV
jgi:glycerol uptake facilitator protein